VLSIKSSATGAKEGLNGKKGGNKIPRSLRFGLCLFAILTVQSPYPPQNGRRKAVLPLLWDRKTVEPDLKPDWF
jgi:hypothetical protein